MTSHCGVLCCGHKSDTFAATFLRVLHIQKSRWAMGVYGFNFGQNPGRVDQPNVLQNDNKSSTNKVRGHNVPYFLYMSSTAHDL